MQFSRQGGTCFGKYLLKGHRAELNTFIEDGICKLVHPMLQGVGKKGLEKDGASCYTRQMRQRLLNVQNV
eukprot:6468444-Amphidinium_carterae.2